MKKFNFLAVIFALVCLSSQLIAGDYKSPNDDGDARLKSIVELSKSANLAAQKAGVAEVGSISCDSQFIVCTCKGAINCAWLALACGEAGGIQGFDNECYLPDSVPDARSAINDFASLHSLEEASCEGIFCSCSGPKDSDDCNKIKARIDDISCVGNNCGCIGGQVD